MAKTNLHEQATRLLGALDQASSDGAFEGTLGLIADEAGLNSARSAEAIKLLEELGRIQVRQRGRRDRKTIISIMSRDAISRADAEEKATAIASKRPVKLDYADLGHAVVDRLIALGRDDALRSAQVEAFAAENAAHAERVERLEETIAEGVERENELRVQLRAAEEALQRSEENLRRAFGGNGSVGAPPPAPVPDDDAKAVLDILRSNG